MLPEDARAGLEFTLARRVGRDVIPPAFSDGNPRPGDRDFHLRTAGSAARPTSRPFPQTQRMTIRTSAPSEIDPVVRAKELGFVVEHRWRETITNIVTGESSSRLAANSSKSACRCFAMGSNRSTAIATTCPRSSPTSALEAVASSTTRCSPTSRCWKSTRRGRARDGRSVRGVFQRLGVEMFDEKGSVVSMEEATRRIKEFARGDPRGFPATRRQAARRGRGAGDPRAPRTSLQRPLVEVHENLRRRSRPGSGLCCCG